MPVMLKPYCIPHALREAVKKELEEMQQTGIIEISVSEWAANGSGDQEVRRYTHLYGLSLPQSGNSF